MSTLFIMWTTALTRRCSVIITLTREQQLHRQCQFSFLPVTLIRFVKQDCSRYNNSSTSSHDDQEDFAPSTTIVSQSEQHQNTNPKQFICPENSRRLRVALVGTPNAGKSTLINSLMQYEVCPTSKRVHTTRRPQRAIFLEDRTQIIFTDTPGIVNKREVSKFNFSKDFAMGPVKSMKGADVVGVIHDIATSRISRNKLDRRVINLLNEFPGKDVVLILNKVDLVPSKRKLLDSLRILTAGILGGQPLPFEVTNQKQKKLTTEDILKRAAKKLERKENALGLSEPELPLQSEYPKSTDGIQVADSEREEDVRGWPNFQEVFMISSLTGDGVVTLKDYLVRRAKDARWDYSEEVLTDYSPPDLSMLLLKSKILEHVPDEAPYKVTPVLEIWEENNKGDLIISFAIKCPTTRILKMVIGVRGSIISSITQETERSLMKLLRRNVHLHVKAVGPEDKSNKSS